LRIAFWGFLVIALWLLVHILLDLLFIFLTVCFFDLRFYLVGGFNIIIKPRFGEYMSE
jgi:hypothetical protein